jgi:membrane protein
MIEFRRNFWGALRRVFPQCIAQSQAVAFNMFLALFPMMLLILGLVVGSETLQGGLLTILGHLRSVLPPGAERIFVQFLTRRADYALQLILLGLGGTLLAGTQMMRLIMDGFQMVYGGGPKRPFWSHNFRAMLLLLATIAPWLLTAHLIVFGKQVRSFMIRRLDLPAFVAPMWAVLYLVVCLLLALLVLSLIYRIGHPGDRGWMSMLPGAALAMLLWWLVSVALGTYLLHLPYGAVYGGLAVVIGLMLWMQLTAIIILIGAAFNAERSSSS